MDDDKTVTANCSPLYPGLSIEKTADPSSADPGDTIEYTITYENTGCGAVNNVTIEDDPDEAYIADIPAISISDGGNYDGDIITWNIGTLDPGESGSVTYTATLAGTGSFSTGTTNVRNTATIDSDETDPVEDGATVAVYRPSEGGGTTRGGSEGDDYCYFDVDMLGEVTRLCYVCHTGRIIKSYVTPDPDEKHFLELEKRTKVTYNRGNSVNPGPPKVIVMTEAEDPPRVPRGMVAVGPIYDFTGYTRSNKACDSVMFDDVIVAILDYPPDDVPGNTASLAMYYYDEEEREWIPVPSDPEHVAGIGTESGQLRHFSSLAVMATLTTEPAAPPSEPEPPAPSPPPAHFTGSNLHIVPSLEKTWEAMPFVTTIGRSVTVTAYITNDGGEEATYLAELKINGATVDSERVRLEPGQSKEVSFTLSVAEYGQYEVTVAGLKGDFTASRTINWALIAGLIVALALIAGVIIWRIRKKRRLAPAE